MNQVERINNFYKELYNDEFIASHGFERYRFGSQEFYSCASTLRSKSGREVTVAFNIHDEEPDQAELVMQFINKCSLEQLRVVGEKIAQKLKKDINVYEEPECISLVCYYPIEEVDSTIEMMKVTLEEVNNVVMFVVK